MLNQSNSSRKPYPGSTEWEYIQKERYSSYQRKEQSDHLRAFARVYDSIYHNYSDVFNEFSDSEYAIQLSDCLNAFFIEKIESIFCSFPTFKGREALRKKALKFFKRKNVSAFSHMDQKEAFEEYIASQGKRELFILSDDKYFWRFNQWSRAIIIRATIDSESSCKFKFDFRQPKDFFGMVRKKHFLSFDRDSLKTLADNICLAFCIINTEKNREIESFGSSPIHTLFKFYGYVAECAKQIGFPMPFYTADYNPDGVSLDEFLFEQSYVELATEYFERLTTVRTWFRFLKVKQERIFEHYARAIGLVRSGMSAYVSQEAFNQFLIFEQYNLDFLKKSKLKSLNGGDDEELTLYSAYKSSVSNPENRVAELNVRARGVDDYAKSLGYKAAFVTATAPSKFHSYGKKGQNHKFEGFDPKEGMEWLTRVWGIVRADFKQHNIDCLGIRCCEPHGDGTPHFHFILYVREQEFSEEFARLNGKGEIILESDLDKALNLMRNAWLRTDPDGFIAFTDGGRAILDDKGRVILDDCDNKGNILKSRSQKSKAWSDGRFNFKLLNWEKGGSPMGYVFKYISKNVFSKDNVSKSDEDSTLTLENNSARVRAWASRWGIRQFQFFGLPPVTVYREMRKLHPKESQVNSKIPLPEKDKSEVRNNLDKLPRDIYESVVNGDFASFISLMKGENKQGWAGKPFYDVQKKAGFFGNDVKSIIGVSFDDVLVPTRFYKWEVEKPKWDGGRYSENNNVKGFNANKLVADDDLDVSFDVEEEEQGQAPPSSQAKKKRGNSGEARRGRSPSWSPMNNCNSSSIGSLFKQDSS